MTSSTDGDSTERDGYVAGLVGSSTHATSDINRQLKVRMGDERFSGLFYVHLLIPAGRRMSFMWPVPSTGAMY